MAENGHHIHAIRNDLLFDNGQNTQHTQKTIIYLGNHWYTMDKSIQLTNEIQNEHFILEFD